MTAAELIAAFRYEADDRVVPYGWSDEDLLPLIDEAQEQAAQRARFFLDSDTKAVTRVVVKANTGVAKLSDPVIQVRRARVVGRQCLLQPTYLRDLSCWPAWEDDAGEPCRFIRDYASGMLRVHPMPTVDTTIAMTVLRGPLNAPIGATDDLEIPQRYQRDLVYWLLHKAFSKRDSGGDQRDDKLAKEYEDKFTQVFGARRSAQDEIFEQQQENVYGDQGGSL